MNTNAEADEMNGSVPISTEEELSELFSYRAEWLGEKLFELFTEPSYFPELMTARPCLLVGGRGTGKTTILKCLGYEGQFALAQRQSASIREWQFFGLYYRVNTNRVNAFDGPELDTRGWIRHFAHYVNLELCDLTLRFLGWRQLHLPDEPTLDPTVCAAVAESLNCPPAQSVRELIARVTDSRIRFEAVLNNIADEGPVPGLSLQGAPVDLLLSSIRALPQFSGRKFFFLIDEYENLRDYQQQVLNTLIKHCPEAYTFKIGVRELGLRVRTTLNPDEQLISPADYVLIPIVEKLGDRFSEFAERVCNERLRRLSPTSQSAIPAVRPLFLELSDEDEAKLLGVDGPVAEMRRELARTAEKEDLLAFDNLSPLFAYFLGFWSNSRGTSLLEALQECQSNPRAWQQRFDNYRYAILFTLRRGKRGIHKYYSGWNVFTKLAAGNIRYLLELVDTTLLAQLRGGADFSQSIPAKVQTEAAQAVGRKNLTELEGLSIHGAKLTKLLLGLGRVFQVMAANPEGHTPEANQFEIGQDRSVQALGLTSDQARDSVDELLQSAVRHLALLRFSGSKPQEEGDTKAYDYMVHPIFSPFFEFSYRRKRKIQLIPGDILGLVRSPNRTISAVLERQNRGLDEPLPEQLRLFEGYYAGGT